MSLADPQNILIPPSRAADPYIKLLLSAMSPEEMQIIARVDPEGYAAFKARVDMRMRELDKEEYEGSLIAFIQRAWQEIESRPLVLNWHHYVLAEHLESVTFGETRHLVCNIPPRHSKSLWVSVFWPAWIWCRSEILPLSGPQVTFLCVSYGAILSEEIALKMRRLVAGDWYQGLWGDRVKMREDQQSRANFANMAGGERMSGSIEGGILGRGADIRIYDDVQTRKGADSIAERSASLQGMADMATRLTDPRTAAQVLIMQRLHERDATDWAIKNWPKDTVWLMFPARFEPDRACDVDPRTYAGELLWPEVWSNEELAKIERGLAALDGEILSDYAVSGQLQQNPLPRGGGIINKDDWQIWPEWTPNVGDMRTLADGTMFIPLPEVSHVIACLDTALEEKATADWNALVVFGVWHRPRHLIQIVGHENNLDDGEQPRVIVMGGWRRRCKLNDETIGADRQPMGLVQRVVATCRRFNVDRLIIEHKTRGRDVNNEIERQIMDMPFQIELFNPKKHGDKVARLHSVQPLFGQRLVYMPGQCRVMTDRAGNQFVQVDEFAWSRELMTEVEAVPKGAHDDYADCVSMGLIRLREDGFLALTQEYIAQQVAARMYQGRRQTIRTQYGV